MARWLLAGNRRIRWWKVISLGILCLLALKVYTFSGQVKTKYEKLSMMLNLTPLPAFEEIEKVEDIILLPPYGLKYPIRLNLNEEFLNASSLFRNVFFPNPIFEVIDPRKKPNKDDYFFFAERVWLDTDGNPIQAHGGGILLDEKSGTYYWYGEYKNGPTYRANNGTGSARVDVIGVGCYSSKDLYAWRFEGVVLGSEREDEAHDLHRSKVLERPKVLYNNKTDKYAMWMHIDDATYDKASVGVAVSDSPTGPFHYLYSFRPNGFDSRDMTVFKDEDGEAYLIYSSRRNSEIHISPMDRDYLGITKETSRVLIGQHREAPALFKDEGVYYMVTSGCSGWLPNEALVHEAESILGPWESVGNPCVGANKDFRVATFFSQGSFVLPMPGRASGSFIFMADRWNPEDLGDSRYIWLPLSVRSRKDRYRAIPLWSRVSIYWRERWRIPLWGDGEIKEL